MEPLRADLADRHTVPGGSLEAITDHRQKTYPLKPGGVRQPECVRPTRHDDIPANGLFPAYPIGSALASRSPENG